LETAELHKLVRSENLILSTGGGAVLAAENQELIRNLGVVINLMAPPEVIAQRLRHANDRPLLNDGASRERIERMLVEREPCYAMAHIRIDTTGKKIEDVAAVILKYLDSVETAKRV
jgi:shikimate kinase